MASMAPRLNLYPPPSYCHRFDHGRHHLDHHVHWKKKTIKQNTIQKSLFALMSNLNSRWHQRCVSKAGKRDEMSGGQLKQSFRTSMILSRMTTECCTMLIILWWVYIGMYKLGQQVNEHCLRQSIALPPEVLVISYCRSFLGFRLF